MSTQKKTSTPTKASGSIATKPAKQIPNTNKREMDMVNPNRKGGGNTPLKMATCGGDPEAIHYDDILESTGTKYSYPAEFQTVIMNNEQQQNIPAWNAMSVSIDAPDAITRTDEPIYHQGFRKAPKKWIDNNKDDNMIISHAHKQDGGTIIHHENSQVDAPFTPTSTTIYGGTLPKGKSSSKVT